MNAKQRKERRLQKITVLGRLGFDHQPAISSKRTGIVWDCLNNSVSEMVNDHLAIHSKVWFNAGPLVNRFGEIIDGWYDGLLQVKEDESGKIYIVAFSDITGLIISGFRIHPNEYKNFIELKNVLKKKQAELLYGKEWNLPDWVANLKLTRDPLTVACEAYQWFKVDYPEIIEVKEEGGVIKIWDQSLGIFVKSVPLFTPNTP